MSQNELPPLPHPGSRILTACGGPALFSESTPRVVFQGKWAFFCLPGCVTVYEQDPLQSCLADLVLESGPD